MQYNAVIVNSNLTLELKQNCSRIIYKVRQSCTWLVKSISYDFTRVKGEHTKTSLERMFLKTVSLAALL